MPRKYLPGVWGSTPGVGVNPRRFKRKKFVMDGLTNKETDRLDGKNSDLDKNRSEVSNKVYHIFLAQLVLELRAI